jgi:two-component system phosphate regulon response regulator PhoB
MRSDILLVQPDPEQCATIRTVLESHGFAVSEAETVEAAGSAVLQARPDAIVVHWSDTASARDFLNASVRRNGHNSCAIITARDAELSDALTALEFGYDDCVRIPINESELLARLTASLKRRQARENDSLAFGPLLLDRKIHCLYINAEPVQLAPTEFRLIRFFLENPGRVCSRDEILKGAWNTSIRTGSRTVDVHVRRLRQILGQYGCDTMIQTVRSFGYRFRELAQD